MQSERPHEDYVVSQLLDCFVQPLIEQFDFDSFDPSWLSTLGRVNLEKFVEIVVMEELPNSDNLKAPVIAEFTIRQLIYLFTMLKVLLKRSDLISGTIRRSLRALVQLDRRASNKQNLLLYACNNLGHMTGHVVPYLIHLGASPNARNYQGNGALHTLVLQNMGSVYIRDATARFLLANGAHLDMANDEGMTAADLWFQKNTPGQKKFADLPDWLQETQPRALKCLCSTVIRRYRVPYDDGAIVPAVLIPFVSIH